jgi:hypothetical protein
MQVVVSSRRHHHLKIQSVLMALCGSDVITQHVCQIDTEAQLEALGDGDIADLCVPHPTMLTVAHELSRSICLLDDFGIIVGSSVLSPLIAFTTAARGLIGAC